jgi:VanZ family protein
VRRRWTGVYARRFGFGIVAGIVFVGMHWPKLALPYAGRPDLPVHMAVFGSWTLACIAASIFGPPLSVKNILASQFVALVYCGIDEWLQAVPFVRRVAGLDDFAANTCGVIAATALALAARFVVGPRAERSR